jgi:heme exporter protein C
MSLLQPKRFLELSGQIAPYLAGGAVLALGAGVFLGLNVPPDFRQGGAVRIMFVHVPAAWTAMMGFVLIALASAAVLIWRHPLADVAAKSAAPLGALFAALGLITGSLWGKPMWGTWWVWDGRLTSFLLLFLLYLGLIALRGAIDGETRAARACAILAIVGAVDLPVIEFSVQWWTTLHQGSSLMVRGGPAMPKVYLWPLFLMALGYTLLFWWLWLVRMRTDIHERRARSRILAGDDHAGL